MVGDWLGVTAEIMFTWTHRLQKLTECCHAVVWCTEGLSTVSSSKGSLLEDVACKCTFKQQNSLRTQRIVSPHPNQLLTVQRRNTGSRRERCPQRGWACSRCVSTSSAVTGVCGGAPTPSFWCVSVAPYNTHTHRPRSARSTYTTNFRSSESPVGRLPRTSTVHESSGMTAPEFKLASTSRGLKTCVGRFKLAWAVGLPSFFVDQKMVLATQQPKDELDSPVHK